MNVDIRIREILQQLPESSRKVLEDHMASSERMFEAKNLAQVKALTEENQSLRNKLSRVFQGPRSQKMEINDSPPNRKYFSTTSFEKCLDFVPSIFSPMSWGFLNIHGTEYVVVGEEPSSSIGDSMGPSSSSSSSLPDSSSPSLLSKRSERLDDASHSPPSKRQTGAQPATSDAGCSTDSALPDPLRSPFDIPLLATELPDFVSVAAEKAANNFWKNLDFPTTSYFFTTSWNFQETVSGLFMSCLQSVFLACEILCVYPQFQYQVTSKDWAEVAGLGAYINDEHPSPENWLIPFLVISSKGGRVKAENILRDLQQSVSNFSNDFRPHFLGVAINFTDAFCIRYRVYLMVSEAPVSYREGGFFRFLIAEGSASIDDTNLARLFASLAWAGMKVGELHQKKAADHDVFPEAADHDVFPEAGSDRLPVRCAEFSGYRVKVFQGPSKRDYKGYFLIKGAKLVVDTPDLRVILYPNISGEACNLFSYPIMFIWAAERLLIFHNVGFAHGDVRLRHLIFDDEKMTSAWISFSNLSHSSKLRRYPAGWETDIPDAKRHPGATENQPILIIHDVYSFLSLLAMYSPHAKLETKDGTEQIWFTEADLDEEKNLDLNVIIERIRQFKATHGQRLLVLKNRALAPKKIKLKNGIVFF